VGRTVPSFRYVLASEKSEWKLFRDALDKKEKRDFDDMWDIARLYISACSNSVQLVPLQPIIVSILFHHYKELKECAEEVEEIIMTMDAKVNNTTLMMEKEKLQKTQKREKELPITLDVFLS
jgi:hypothetical protein